MSSGNEFLPENYQFPKSAHKPALPGKPDTPRRCKVVVRMPDDRIYLFGSLTGGSQAGIVRVSLDISSPMPLIALRKREGTTEVRLVYDSTLSNI